MVQSDTKKTKCLAVFQMKDTSGVLDTYVSYLLEKLSPLWDELIIICSENLQAQACEKLAKFTNQFLKYSTFEDIEHMLIKTCTMSLVKDVEQILLFDDRFYGPIYPLSQEFMMMKQEGCAMWGITDVRQKQVSPMQSCFAVFNHKALEMGLSGSQEEEIEPGEDFVTHMIQKLLNQGVEWRGYITFPQEWKISKAMPEDYNILLSYELIRDFSCPFLLKEALLNRQLEYTDGGNAERSLNYIKNFTEYDENFIWDNLLRTCHMRDLKEALALEYVLPDDHKTGIANELKQSKIAVIAHMHYEDLVSECIAYLRQLSEDIDIYITTSNPVVIEKIQENQKRYSMKNLTLIWKKNRGRDVSGLLVACKEFLLQYEYLCFVHDKKTSQNPIMTLGKNWMYEMWENTVKSMDYVSNIIQCFEDHPRLGLLSVPEPYHGFFFGSMGDLWAGNFENTKRLADRLSLTCKIEESRAPFVLSTAFWCRTHAMKPLFSYPFSYEDFADESMQEIGSLSHAVERILPYVAQHQGYYSGIVMNADYAALSRANLQYLLEQTVKTLKENRVVSTIADVRDYKIRNAEIRSFSKRFLHVLIYGIGNYGKQCGCMLIESDCEFDGFVVSDGQYKTERFLSHPVYYLSEVVMNPNACGMILMVGKRYQDEILEQLRAKGYENIYVLV